MRAIPVVPFSTKELLILMRGNEVYVGTKAQCGETKTAEASGPKEVFELMPIRVRRVPCAQMHFSRQNRDRMTK